MAWGVPLIGVNHLEAHLFASLLEQPDLGWPLAVLLVSGGHTLLIEVSEPGRYRVLGGTIDDAAGEAFDKVARFLGLGYPGGPAIDRIADEGDPHAFAFPRSLPGEGYDFSFSGLKTSVVNTVRKQPDASTADVAASFRLAVVDVLVAEGQTGRGRDGRQGPVPGRRRGGQRPAAPADRSGLRRGRDRSLPAQPGPVHGQRRHGGRRRMVAAATRGTESADPRSRPQFASAHRRLTADRPLPAPWSESGHRAARPRPGEFVGTRRCRLPNGSEVAIVSTLNARLLTRATGGPNHESASA